VDRLELCRRSFVDPADSFYFVYSVSLAFLGSHFFCALLLHWWPVLLRWRSGIPGKGVAMNLSSAEWS
jgi:hypothetical protein